jgi:hypothetical protein
MVRVRMLQGNKRVARLQMPIAPEILRRLHNRYRHSLHSPQEHWNKVWRGATGGSPFLQTGRAVDA